VRAHPAELNSQLMVDALLRCQSYADACNACIRSCAAPDAQSLLLAFYDYPAEHWVHLRTTNPIESTFATVRLRTKVTKGHGSKAAGLAMAFKLIESAPTPRTWSRSSGPERPSSTASSPGGLARTPARGRLKPPARR
jgi:transposase-like protein